MTSKIENLSFIDGLTITAISYYQRLLPEGFDLGVPEFCSLADGKNYSARSSVNLYHNSNKLATLPIIAFASKDGSGSEVDFQRKDLSFQEDFKGNELGAIPRRKEGIVCEGFLPLFSGIEGGNFSLFSTCLDLMILHGMNGRNVVQGFTLGKNLEEFRRNIVSSKRIEPVIQFTTGTMRGERFADPHAVYNNVSFGFNSPIQVAAFLTITDKNSPLMELTKDWEMPLTR